MATVVGVCTLRLSIPGIRDLKSKRRVLQSIIARLREAFNVAVAETEDQDKWQAATLVLVTVSNDSGYVHGLLTKAIESVQRTRLDAEISDFDIELLT